MATTTLEGFNRTLRFVWAEPKAELGAQLGPHEAEWYEPRWDTPTRRQNERHRLEYGGSYFAEPHAPVVRYDPLPYLLEERERLEAKAISIAEELEQVAGHIEDLRKERA